MFVEAWDKFKGQAKGVSDFLVNLLVGVMVFISILMVNF